MGFEIEPAGKPAAIDFVFGHGLVKLGVRPDQIARLRNTHAAEIGELSGMTTRIGVDAQEASLPVRIDLHLNCAECTERRLCTRWLASSDHGAHGAGYRVFCPNERLLDRLIQIRRWRGIAGKGHQSEMARTNFRLGTLTPAALKRARKLARSGECKNLAEISNRLKLEGFAFNGDAFVSQNSVLADVGRILRLVDEA